MTTSTPSKSFSASSVVNLSRSKVRTSAPWDTKVLIAGFETEDGRATAIIFWENSHEYAFSRFDSEDLPLC